MRRILVLVSLAVVFALGTASAGDPDAMAEYMNCSICKPMVENMEALGPVMMSEVIRVNDGVAMHSWITDESKVELYHGVWAQMAENGAACEEYTPEQAKEKLCPICLDIYNLMGAGASMSTGKSDNGSLMVITSADADVQAKIAAFSAKCEMMNSGEQGT